MAKAGRNVAIHVNGYNLSGFFSKEESQFTQAFEDTTAFGPSVVAKSWTPTLSEASLSLDGFYDTTATVGQLAVLNGAFAKSGHSIVSIWHVGDAVAARGLAMQGDMKTKKRATPVDGVVKMSAEFTSSTGEEDVISLHALAQETADGNGTTVDNGASSANGGAVYLHVTEMTTALAVTVRHSTDNFVSSDVLLATFTADPAAGTAQRIALTGTINRYVRVVWDLTDDATFGAAINRR